MDWEGSHSPCITNSPNRDSGTDNFRDTCHLQYWVTNSIWEKRHYMSEEYTLHRDRRVATLNPKSRHSWGGGHPCSYSTPRHWRCGRRSNIGGLPPQRLWYVVVQSGLYSLCGISPSSVTDRDSFSSSPFTGVLTARIADLPSATNLPAHHLLCPKQARAW